MAMNKQARRVSKLPHDVYRVFDASGALLYVGCSVNVFARLKEHRKWAEWWPEAVRGSVHRYPNRLHALGVEARAIRNECPRDNKVLEAHWGRHSGDPLAVLEEPMALTWEDGEVWVDGEG